MKKRIGWVREGGRESEKEVGREGRRKKGKRERERERRRKNESYKPCKMHNQYSLPISLNDIMKIHFDSNFCRKR